MCSTVFQERWREKEIFFLCWSAEPSVELSPRGKDNSRDPIILGARSCGWWWFVHGKHLDITLLKTWKYWKMCTDFRARTQRNSEQQYYLMLKNHNYNHLCGGEIIISELQRLTCSSTLQGRATQEDNQLAGPIKPGIKGGISWVWSLKIWTLLFPASSCREFPP